LRKKGSDSGFGSDNRNPGLARGLCYIPTPLFNIETVLRNGLLSSTQSRINRPAQIKAAEVALEGVQREAQVGSRTVLDVLDAEQELLDAKVSLVRAQRDLVAATAQLKEATGELTAKHLTLDVPIYDVNKHYKEVRDSWVGGTSSGDSDSK